MTPSGKFGKVGTVVATIAVPVNGVVVQQCICDAVVSLVRPVKSTRTRIVLAAMSKSTSANPVPGDALGGLSLGPLSVAVDSIRPAVGAGAVSGPGTISERPTPWLNK